MREGEELLVHSMDRLARNSEDMLRIVRELVERGITVRFVTEGLGFCNESSARSQFHLEILAVFAQFERSLICERQREGIEQAKLRGVYKGRQP